MNNTFLNIQRAFVSVTERKSNP